MFRLSVWILAVFCIAGQAIAQVSVTVDMKQTGPKDASGVVRVWVGKNKAVTYSAMANYTSSPTLQTEEVIQSTDWLNHVTIGTGAAGSPTGPGTGSSLTISAQSAAPGTYSMFVVFSLTFTIKTPVKDSNGEYVYVNGTQQFTTRIDGPYMGSESATLKVLDDHSYCDVSIGNNGRVDINHEGKDCVVDHCSVNHNTDKNQHCDFDEYTVDCAVGRPAERKTVGHFFWAAVPRAKFEYKEIGVFALSMPQDMNQDKDYVCQKDPNCTAAQKWSFPLTVIVNGTDMAIRYPTKWKQVVEGHPDISRQALAATSAVMSMIKSHEEQHRKDFAEVIAGAQSFTFSIEIEACGGINGTPDTRTIVTEALQQCYQKEENLKVESILDKQYREKGKALELANLASLGVPCEQGDPKKPLWNLVSPQSIYGTWWRTYLHNGFLVNPIPVTPSP